MARAQRHTRIADFTHAESARHSRKPDSSFSNAVYPQDLDWAHLICVALCYAFKGQPLHRATHHHFCGAFSAFQNLHQLGYRRIGLVIDEAQNTRVDYSWLGGYLAAAHMFESGKL